MVPIRRAVIDIGTNSIKLLVADVAGRDIRPVWEESKQTRLGRGFYETRRLQPAAIAATAKAVAEFAALAREHQAAAIRLIATSAARDAINHQDLTSAIESASGSKVEIISGDHEADMVFRGVTTDSRFAEAALLLLDVGGGSTEFIFGHGQDKFFRQSFPLGTVRLLEKIPHSDPPKPEELSACRQWLRAFLEREVKPGLMAEAAADKGSLAPGAARFSEGVLLVGTGGSASILGCMEAKLERFDRERLEATRLSFERLRWHVDHLWRLPLEERKQVVGLPKNRADVILTGVVIYEAVMEVFGFAELRLSTRGLRFAAVMEETGG